MKPEYSSHHSPEVTTSGSRIQKDFSGDHENPESAGGLHTESQGVQARAPSQGYTDSEDSGVKVDDHHHQQTDSEEDIQSAILGILKLQTAPVEFDTESQRVRLSSSSGSTDFLLVERLEPTSPENSISRLPNVVMIDKTKDSDEDFELESVAGYEPEYFQEPNEVVQMSCQECAAGFPIVHPSFHVPESIRRRLQLQADSHEGEIEIPVISLKLLMVEERAPAYEKYLVKCQVSEACREWGVFQVRDHGIPNLLLESALDAAKRFFDLPMKEKMVYSLLYSDDESGYGGRRSSHFRLWGDSLLHVLQLEKSLQENNLPTIPPRYGEFILKYAKLVMVLNMQLIDACAQVQDVDVTELETELNEQYLNIIAKSYGTSLEICRRMPSSGATNSDNAVGGNMNEDWEREATATALRVNYHPPCPQPELVLCVDPCHARTAFEIVLQNEVPGLQILRNDRWRTVKHIPNALVVFVGRSLEILSQDMVSPYQTVQFRVLAHRSEARISITTAIGLHLTGHL